MGYYQDTVGQTNCLSCEGDRTTEEIGSSSFDKCICFDNKHDNGEICTDCPENTYSNGNSECLPCENTGGSTKPGKGCYCQRGMEWDSKLAKCVERVVDRANALKIGFYGLAAVLVNFLI